MLKAFKYPFLSGVMIVSSETIVSLTVSLAPPPKTELISTSYVPITPFFISSNLSAVPTGTTLSPLYVADAFITATSISSEIIFFASVEFTILLVAEIIGTDIIFISLLTFV